MGKVSLAFNLLGALAVFLYGMKVMSEALQKAAGQRLRQILATATSNRVSGTLSGFLVTCFVQSSSATTVMVVGFCSAGLLTLFESMSIMLGANIGTTTTAWIVSLLGFKIKITSFALPLIGLGFFSRFVRRPAWVHKVGEVLVGFGLLFLGLHLLKEAIPNVQDAPQIIGWMTRYDANFIGPRILAVLVGAVITMIFQSSSAVMAVTITCAAKGLIDFPTSAALVLGENIGTTITANLAAIGAPRDARRAAIGNSICKTFGVLWAVLLFKPFLYMVDVILPGDPYGTSQNSLLVAIPTHIAAYHTLFNVIDVLVVLPFLRHVQRLLYWILPRRKKKDDEHELVYVSTPLVGTPELAIPAAQKEVDRMAGVALRMLRNIRKALGVRGRERLDLAASIRKDEQTTDALEHKINEFLAELTHGPLSTAANKEVLSLLSMINDLERIGDHGEKLAILLKRKEDGPHRFTPEAQEDIERMAGKAEEILVAMKELILNRQDNPMPKAITRESELNELRNRFRRAHLARLAKKKCSPMAGIIFTDMLISFEKMGDHAFNVVEACAGIK